MIYPPKKIIFDYYQIPRNEKDPGFTRKRCFLQ